MSAKLIPGPLRWKLLILSMCISLLGKAQNTPLTVLPFDLKNDNRIYIKCRINQSDSLTFLFDTGADVMVINQDILGKKLNLMMDSEMGNLGANGNSKLKVSTKNTLSFGNITAGNISLMAIPYGKSPFDGVFGSNLMKDYVIEIDYHKKLIRFYANKNYVYDTGAYDTINLKSLSGVFTTTASLTVDNKTIEGEFEIDTGGDGGLIISSNFSTSNHLFERLTSVAKATAVGSDGTKSVSPIVIIPEIILKDKHFYRIPALLSNTDSGLLASKGLSGIFGNGFLKRFDVILDIQNSRIFLKINDLIHTPYYDWLIK